MDKTAIKQLIRGLIAHFGITYTMHVLDHLKNLGFGKEKRRDSFI
jgi:hypothetical protein